MRVSFYGACREVTGSNILVECAGKKILLDCGLFQGTKMAEERNFSDFIFDAKTIDAVIVGHAHLDHVGRLPKLVRGGFRSRTYSTAPTKELAELVLEDSEKLMREESERENHQPLFSLDDVRQTMELFETIGYEQKLEIFPGIDLTFKNAGHILGSAITVLKADGKTLVYTSDLGNNPSQLLDPPALVTSADVLICESTYGSRVHEDPSQRVTKLATILNSTIAQNGVLMIPSFAIERTQELLHDIDSFCMTTNCDKPTFFLDSPLAEKVTKVFEKYLDYLKAEIQSEEKLHDVFGEERIKFTPTVEESKAIDTAPLPKVVIAGSGMLNGGRILHHLINYIEDPKNTLLIVGYQSAGTLGRRILDGEKLIKIFGRKHRVGVKVLAIGSYSAHADQPQVLAWLEHIKNLKKIFLVHGETNESLALSQKIRSVNSAEVLIPQQGERFDL